MEPIEPKICTGCTINPCKGEPWSCAQDAYDDKAEREYERRRDEQ